MDKWFFPNKWFVFFCALLVLVWLLLQAVVNLRITGIAKFTGQQIFTWSWPSKNWTSSAKITKADVLHRTGADAIVKVQGRQVLTMQTTEKPKIKVVNCAAILTFYRKENVWVLGKVEFK